MRRATNTERLAPSDQREAAYPFITDLLVNAAVPGPPPARPVEVHRPHLQSIKEAFEGRVVLLSAPPGYGKSMAAAQWCRAERRPVIWLPTDQRDDDPIALGLRLLVALHAIAPLSEEAISTMAGSPARLERLILPTITRAVAARSPLVIAIDDSHHLQSAGAVMLLQALIDSIDEDSLIVLATRVDPSLDLHRLRTDGDLLEIRAGRLAMDSATVGAVLDRVGSSREQPELESIVHLTEGWPAGVGLVGLRGTARATVGPRSASVPRHDFSDYFLDEVLSAIAGDTLDFLRRAAVLREFSAELCDVALERNDSAQMLRRLERSNVFLIPLDAEYTWFRYHHLFAEFLDGQGYAIDVDERAAILGRAARWHQNNARPYDALVAAQASGDVTLFGTVALETIEPWLASGRLESVRAVLERSTDDEIAGDTRLSLVASHVYSRLGDMPRARMFLDAAVRADDLDVPASNGASSLHALALITRNSVWQTSVRTMLADGQQIIEGEAAASRFLVSGHRIAGCALLHQGRTTEAIAFLERGDRLSTARSDHSVPHVLIAGYLILALLEDRQRAAAFKKWADIRAFMEPARLAFASETIAASVAEAGIALSHDDPTTARSALEVAHQSLDEMGILPVMRADLAVRAAELAIALDDRALAADLASIAERALDKLSDSGTIGERLRSAQRDIDTTLVALDDLTPAERRVLEQLATHLTLQEIGQHLYIGRATVKTHVGSIYRKLGVNTRREAVAYLAALTPRGAASLSER